MMQTCPRCGFVQPEDKYCANCGLDIENFKPAPTPLFKRIFGNTAVQIGIVVLIVIAATIAILLSQKNRVDKQLQRNFAHVPMAVESPANKSQVPAQSAAETQPSKIAAKKPAPGMTATSPFEKSSVKQVKNSKVDEIAPKELAIGFYELSRASIMQLASEGQVLSETPQSRSMVLHLAHPFLKLREKVPNMRPLGAVITHGLLQGHPINLDYMRPTTPDSGMNGIGASFSLNPVKVSAKEIELALDLMFNMRNHSGNSLITNEVNSTFTFSPKSTLVLSGFFPHRRVFRQDLMAFNGTPLAILASPEFLNSVTDLVIVLKTK